MKVVGMGEALWDVLPEGKKIGGAPANFAYHVSQFGLDSCAVSAIGDDDLGNELIEKFDERKLNYILDKVPYPTGEVNVDMKKGGMPVYHIKENVAWDNIALTDRLVALAAETSAVCFGSLAQRSGMSRETINKFLDLIPAENDPLIVFDINLRENFYTKEVICDSLERCNILKINNEELDIMSDLFGWPDSSMEEKCRELLKKYNLRMLILTCGTNGSYVFTPDEESFLPTPKVTVDDTVGAGDSFTAAFISSILRGKSVKEAHAKAVTTSAFVCTQAGAMPVLPAEITEA